MRRSDRQVQTQEEILDILERCGSVRIAMLDGDRPYLVPMNFGCGAESGTPVLYLHSARQGRKIDILRENPKVCFEADIPIQVAEGDIACGWTQKYESVIGFGTACFPEDPAEKKAGLTAIVRHYGFEGTPEFLDSMLEKTCVIRVDISEMTGKRNL